MISVPRLDKGLAIADQSGRPTLVHIQWWDEFARMLEQVIADNAAVDATQTAALDVLNDTVVKANLAYERVGPGAYAFTTSATLPVDCRTAIVDTTAGVVTLTLNPVASSLDAITVKKTDASANNVVVDGNGAETIDGAATSSWNTQYQSKTFLPALGAWHIVAVNP